eukprot:TRINITY_DN63865_c0_g1_i1.p2 TRINITY_DN63865_c0_g1~~TRINITY_DN63865_c0_g1_i1.p2  ORF type:complete len:208 (-),score=34.31 TRINITY_DN63865_c0_g1_i1:164-709(-)
MAGYRASPGGGYESHQLSAELAASSGDFQEQISYGCRLVQEACVRKVSDMEKELDGLRQEVAELRRQGEGLRDRNHQLEADLAEKRRRAQEQLDENRGVAQQARVLREQLRKLGKFRETLGEAFSSLDTDRSGALDQTEYNQARSEYGLRADFRTADRDHNGVISRQEFATAYNDRRAPRP